MSHYAKIENGIVTQVIVAEAEFIQSGAMGDPASWIQTSYNTRLGVHTNGGTPLRKNYAGIGYIYDAARDAFYTAKPEGTWILNEQTCQWERPTPYPEDGQMYYFDETTQTWLVTDDVLKAYK